jgi:hypothetical protein
MIHKITHKKIISLLLLSILYYLFISFVTRSVYFGILNSLFGVMCLSVIIIGSPNSYSLIQTISASFLFLVGIIPSLEYGYKIIYWGGDASVLNSYETAMLYSIIGFALLFIGWLFGYKLKIIKEKNDGNQKNGNALFVFFISLALCILLKDVANFGQIGWLLYQTIIFPAPSIVLINYLIKGKRSAYITVLMLIVVIAFNSPVSMPRWQAAMVYLAILLALYRHIFNINYVFVSIVMFGLMSIFPLLDLQRIGYSNISGIFNFEWVFAGHFDSFQNFARVIADDLITNGLQLLGVLGFFIPRSLWVDKPSGSGHFLAENNGLSLTNIAMNFLGEGYINFSVFGIVCFCGIFGIVAGVLDAKYKKHKASKSTFNVYYLMLIGMVFFIIRGDLMSSISYLIGTLTSIYIIGIASRIKVL